MNRIHWKGRREKFAQEHDSDLRRFYAVRRVLQETVGDKNLTPKAWQSELDQLKSEYGNLAAGYKPIREEMLKFLQIQSNVNAILKDRGIDPKRQNEQTR